MSFRKLRESHQAARVHHTNRRRRHNVATARARAAGGQAADIGYLGANTASMQSQWTAAFVQRFRELGWIEGRTVALVYRWAEGRNELMAEIAVEFVRLKVDLIFTGGTAAVIAAKQATADIAGFQPLPVCRFETPCLSRRRI